MKAEKESALLVEVDLKEVLRVTSKGEVLVNGKKRFTNKALSKTLFDMVKIMRDYYGSKGK